MAQTTSLFSTTRRLAQGRVQGGSGARLYSRCRIGGAVKANSVAVDIARAPAGQGAVLTVDAQQMVGGRGGVRCDEAKQVVGWWRWWCGGVVLEGGGELILRGH